MASVGFRWLDILEKEFDNAFVDLNLDIGELHYDEPELVYNVRQKLCTLSSCFAQLTHKAQTIFENSAKMQAEHINMRAELVESKSKREVLEKELHNLLLQLHSSQLSRLPGNGANFKQDANLRPDASNIKKKLDDELKKSPSRTTKCSKETDELKFNSSLLEATQLKTENRQLQLENSALRNSILALNSEVCGAKLAAKYLDKELAGRIQQLQLLGREMRGDVRDKLWRQLESEILLQRHKTVVRECRRNSLMNGTEKSCPKPELNSTAEQNFGDIRTVVVRRKPGQGLGISITGGREHGVPILISELEPNGPASLSGQLYIGDAILSVNDRDLRQACHKEAVDILKQQSEDCVLQVQYIAADDSDNSLEEEGFNFRYRFFDSEVCDRNDAISLHPLHVTGVMNTPTAPRTPESSQESGDCYDSPEHPQTYENISTGLVELISNVECILDAPNATIEELRSEIEPNANMTTPILIPTTDNTRQTNETFETNRNESTAKVDNLILVDNTANLIGFEQNNINCSNNSLNSENLSSPMQTSTDIFLDSELLSTDVASNDSQSPKNMQIEPENKRTFTYETKKLNEFCLSYSKPIYASTETFSNTKSDQSLLNTSSDSSPVHKTNRDYKKTTKKHHKSKKYFGVKTLQSIFSKYDGYSDISSTASDFGDDLLRPKKDCLIIEEKTEQSLDCSEETSPQFEENIHNILSEMFSKNFTNLESPSSITINKTTGNKKHFKMYGHHLRVGKALRLCPNEDVSKQNTAESERREKLLARYVYNANSINADGVGDPYFGTPV